MLESLFKGILNISLYATVVAVAVMFIKLICGKRLSPNFHYGIWFLFLFKLVFPFEIKSMLSIFSFFNHVAPEPITEQINTVLPPITTGVFVQSANLPSPNATAEMPVVVKGLDLWNVAAILWLIGVIIMLAVLLFSYIKTSKILKTTSEKPDSRLLDNLSICQGELNIRYNIPVYTTGSFGIPFIFGFIKPMVILPVHIYNKLPDAGIKAILLHELMHIKRKDYLVNLILFLLKSVYWFNPIVWLAFAWMKNDAERACDSAVVEEYSTEKRGEYAKALLDVAASVGKRTYIPAISAFTEGNFKERIKNVLIGRRYSFMAASIAIIVFTAAGIILLTGAQAKSEKTDGSQAFKPGTIYSSINGKQIIVHDAGNSYSIDEDGTVSISYRNGAVTTKTPLKLDMTRKTWDRGISEGGFFISEDKTAIVYGSSDEESSPLQVLISDDMGKTWNEYTIPGAKGYEFFIGFTNKNHGWLVSGASRGVASALNYVFQTSDGGKTWEEIGNPNDIYSEHLTGAGFFSKDIGFLGYRYFMDDGPVIYWTKDQGKSWDRLSVSLPEKFNQYKKDPLSPNFNGEIGLFPIALIDKDAEVVGTIFLSSKDAGLTWVYDEKYDKL